MAAAPKSGGLGKSKGVTSTPAAEAQKPVEVKKPSIATPIRPAAFKIQSALSEIKYFNLFCYGMAGIGKTRLAATAVEVPQMQDVLLIDTERGRLSLQDSGIDLSHMDVVDVEKYSQIARIYEFLLVHVKFRDEDNVAKLKELEAKFKGIDEKDVDVPRKYRTIIVDTLSEAEKQNYDSLLGGGNAVAQLDDDQAVAGWDEYKKNNRVISTFVRKFRDLPIHCIMTAHDKWIKDERNVFNYTPQMTGQLARYVQGQFDMVGFLAMVAVEEGQARRLHVQRSASPGGLKYDAKNRFAAFKGTHFDNPTIGGILKAVGLLREDKSVVK